MKIIKHENDQEKKPFTGDQNSPDNGYYLKHFIHFNF